MLVLMVAQSMMMIVVFDCVSSIPFILEIVSAYTIIIKTVRPDTSTMINGRCDTLLAQETWILAS